MRILIYKAVCLTAVLLIVLFSGCETSPPVAPQEPVFEYGKVFVTSNVTEAGIFIDNQNSGKVTPDTIQALTGTRNIKLVKAGYADSTVQVTVLKDSTISINVELQTATYGKVFVTSNITGAEIHIDDQNSGKVTPDTIQAATGSRNIKLVKEGYLNSALQVNVIEDSTISVNIELQEETVNKVVLLEDFANVSCIPCVTSNKITHSLSESYAGRLHIIKFPTNFPKPTDPFYLAAKPDCDARMAYYSIITAPTIIIDGVTRPVSSDSNSIKNAIDAALTEEPAFDISVTDSVNNGNIYVDISVAPVNTAGLDFNDYVIQTAIVEKRIDTGTPPGSNGESVFYDVLRKMLPSSSGLELLESNLTSTVGYTNQVQISSSWNLNEIVTIVYIQNKNTKKVLQAASAE